MRKFRVGIDSYSLKPLGLSPLGLLDWTAAHSGEGVQFSEAPAEAADRGFLVDLRDCAREKGFYLEWGGGQHIPFDPGTRRPIDIMEVNRRAADQAAALGTKTVRSCSGGLLKWGEDPVPTETYLREMAGSLRAQRSMFEDRGVVLAIETHFEFTTFELLRLFDMCGAEPGGYLGICLDTMNLLTMLEDPVAAARRVLPWIVTTHVKDGGILAVPQGFVTFTAEAGAGIVDFRKIFELLGGLEREVMLSIEDHGGDFLIPFEDPAFRSRFPDLERAEVETLRALAVRTLERMRGEGLAVLERSRWPEICEARVARDIEAVKALAAGPEMPRP